jgi:hypothetical protein
MKLPSYRLLSAFAITLALSSCAQLAGTAVSLDDQGNALLSFNRPLVISTK